MRMTLLLSLLCAAVLALAACSSHSAPCTATTEAACTATDSGNGYGKCVWSTACAPPTVETSCATYTDADSCTSACTWTGSACTGTPGGSGLPCENYTTKVACELPCFWDGTSCTP